MTIADPATSVGEAAGRSPTSADEASASPPRAALLGIGLLLVFAFVALRAPYLSMPLERDEGEYAYIAWRLAEGDVPYRDAFDQKPPAIFAVYWTTQALLGHSVEAIHLVLGAWSAVTAAALGILVARLRGRTAGLLAAGFFVALGNHPVLLGTAANTEIFMLLPTILAVGCLLRGGETGLARWWFAAGGLAMLACWFKPVAAPTFALIGLWACIALPGPARGRRIVHALLAAASGAAVAAAPVVAAFYAAGALSDLAQAVFFHNLDYAGRMPLRAGLAKLAYEVGVQAPALGVPWLLATLGLVLPDVSPARSGAGARPSPAGAAPRTRTLLGVWLFCSMVGASIGMYFRPHYFIQLLPPLCALAALPLARACEWTSRRGALAGGAALLAAALLVLLPPTAAQAPLLRAGSPELRSRMIYGANPFSESAALARYIRDHSEPGDRVFILGSEPQILFHAQRASASRFIYVYPLTAPTEAARTAQRETVREVEAAEPLFILVVSVGSSLLRQTDTAPMLFDEIARLTREAYEPVLVGHWAGPDAEYTRMIGDFARSWLARVSTRTDREPPPHFVLYRRRDGSAKLP